MKSIMYSTKLKSSNKPPKHKAFRYATSSCIILTLFVGLVFAINSTSALTKKQIRTYSANNIYFMTPNDECIPGNGTVSSICGKTAKEKYWSALRMIGLKNTQIAGIFGSIAHEGFFSPTIWQFSISPQNSGTFASGVTWEGLYDGSISGGIGAFQNTSWKTEFLHDLEKSNPDLLKYYKDPSYSFSGDTALEKIGEKDFDRLVEQDVKLFTQKYRKDAIDKVKTLDDIDEVADYWTKQVEDCACCGGPYAQAHGGCDSQVKIRRDTAHKELEEIKTFTCTGTSNSNSSSDTTDTTDTTDNADDSDASSTTTDSDSPDTDSTDSDDTDSTETTLEDGITWIGDSYSVAANQKGLIADKLQNVDFGSGKPDTSSSNIQVNKFVSSGDKSNPSCLSILENIIKSNQLKKTLVFACGTNGGWTDEDITKFQSLLKDKDVKAVVVNSKIPGNDYTDSNNRLQKLASENDNISLADWVSVYDEKYFTSDKEKIHPNDDPGYEKWVDVIVDAINDTSGNPSDPCPPEDNTNTSNNVLASVEAIIKLANKNGSEYTWGGGHTSDKSVFDAMLNGSPINVDCTGFASLVMYMTYGVMTSFTSYSIFTDPLYEEIPKDQVRPGDIFAYNSPSGHGGIVIEVKNGKVTKIAETGGTEGRSGNNSNIGYSGSSDFSVTNANGPNGHFFRFKGAQNGK